MTPCWRSAAFDLAGVPVVAQCTLPDGHPGSHQGLVYWPNVEPAAPSDVPCPTCGAVAGEPCPHPDRDVLARFADGDVWGWR
jgi:hypothetical protein